MTSVNRLIIWFLSVLVIALLFNSCISKYEDLASTVKAIVHRGYHLVHLENTIESFSAAQKKGFQHIEIDISFTKDFQPVILHDNLLDKQSDTSGSINDFNFSELNNITLNGGYKIPSLVDFFQRFGDSFETVFIDLKEPCPDSGLISIAKILENHNTSVEAITTCTNLKVIRRLKELNPNLSLGADNSQVDFEVNIDECIKQGYKHVLVSFTQLDKNLCFIANSNGIKVYAYTPNTQTDILKTLKFGVDGIMSDNPDLLQQMLN